MRFDEQRKIIGWMSGAAVFIGLISFFFIALVDLRPSVSPDFFFGSNDPGIADTVKISKIFPADDFLIISVASRDITSSGYMREVSRVTDKLKQMEGFSKIISVSHGPKSIATALASPFWRPLLINQDETATLIVGFTDRNASKSLVPAVEQILGSYENTSAVTDIYMSGMPFIAEQIRKSIVRDAKLFSSLALVIFALLIGWLFSSPMIALGSSVSGITAIFATLNVLYLLGQPVGILTANLAVIVFVLVQSQVIYLINNWRRESLEENRLHRIQQAIGKTFKPSLWCAVTTLLGFLSLMFVSAEPLRQLGQGGVVGVLAALLCCFFIFPPFLYFCRDKPLKIPRKKSFSIFDMKKLQYFLSGLLVLIVIATLPGLFQLQTDPSLLSYFKTGGEIETGLSAIDRSGGSSPLQLVISEKSGAELDSADAYEKLWKLHKALEKNDDVGTVLSLPALLSEANDYPLAFLLPWREIVSLLTLDVNQNAVKNFLSEDRTQALFLLRMKEVDRTAPRIDVIENVKKIVAQNGFRTDLTGGVYALQGNLSTLVSESIVTGVLSLLFLFGCISYLVTRKTRLSLAMLGAAAVIPVICLGAGGFLKIPLDVISAPAVSVSLGLAVDALIHLGLAVKRKGDADKDPNVWGQALKEQGPGILASAGIVSLGFLIFSFSGFPPTSRFGATVVVGALLACVASLALFPVLSRLLQARTGQ
ncbi:MAG: MMPL family transporter [Sneathiella sp.]|nr:MMPL family transporter [Sneathiella sp.]